MEGRWTIHVCKDCGQRAHYQDKCQKDRRRIWTEQIPVPVVPCDDAAVERAARAMALHGHERGPDDYWRELAEAALRAAGEAL